MPSVVFYFQVHQPFRLKRHRFVGNKSDGYFDDQKNGEVLRKVAHKCYLPTNRLIKELIEKHEGRFKVSFSVTGVAIEQMKLYSPECLESFIELSKTGCVEFLAETYYHSLSAVFDEEEFKAQVSKQVALVQELFGVSPKVFRNTELIYDDRIGGIVADLGFSAVIAEGADDILDWRSPNFVYSVAGRGNGARSTKLLLKNYRLSDDIAFRFGNRGWNEYPLTTEKFANWVHQISGNGEILNLFMDYETFGEHQWESTGIFEFMRHLPEAIMRHPDWDFLTPSEAIDRYRSVAEMPFYRLTSWADVHRDLTAWRGNRMQESALQKVYALKKKVLADGRPEVVDTWRKLQTSDHYYYMCTKWFADGDVHAYFSPYESPYDAFIYYMNTFKDFESILKDRPARRSVPEEAHPN